MPTIEKPSIAQSFWLDQPTGLAFRNTETAIQRQTEEINSKVVFRGDDLSGMGPTTSAQLAALLTDETGTGLVVFDTSPTIVTATLTTPTIATPVVTGGTFTSPVIATDITVPNTGLHLLDTNASHDLIVKPGSDLTADRTLTVTTGDANRTLNLSADLTVSAATTLAGPASDTAAGPIEIADRSEMEAASSTTLAVTPGRQHYHPAAAKFWVRFNAAGTVAASYNVTSISKNSTGDWTVTIATDFSSANWAPMAFGGFSSVGGLLTYNAVSIAAGTFRVAAQDRSGTSRDPDSPDIISVFGFGDQ
jgi:hypothetical protein